MIHSGRLGSALIPGAGVASNRRSRLLDRWLVLLIALAVPLAIAVAWIPLRTRLPNTDLALILVVAVAGVGALGRREAILVSAVTAAFWFEFFDTAPFDRLTIARILDVETTLVLAVVAVMAGELARRTARHRQSLRSESEELTSVREAAELVASGEELVRVIDVVAEELRRLLCLDGCRFEAVGVSTQSAQITRDGRLAAIGSPAAVPEVPLVAGLAVVVQGEELGRFVLGFGSGSSVTRDRLLVAITLADQVGAAFLAQAPPPMPPGGLEPVRGLRALRPHEDRAPAGEKTAKGQETAGFSSAADRLIS